MTKTIRRRQIQASNTPVRAALKTDSTLLNIVKDGLGAVVVSHRSYFDEGVRSLFGDSLDIDAALKEGKEQENRWDYLLGHTQSNKIIGVEPHSAENSEITTVIKKRKAALSQLQEHLRAGVLVSKWLWVASGRVQFAPMEKATLRLAQNGIEFVGRKIKNKHFS
ncbi:hypothetical protein AiwAL_08020 [Acidiphilium sp. AL]|uniref:hypothetical protein n=1 Tax=Acidiphilium sp. AL TaxID=2871704 RepID=UPI0021CB45FB|nr:hypothetical protein [Acidiphilium sp. AL]MCU4160053.1 hypothetical protein [Acidiphilium sp. AL]